MFGFESVHPVTGEPIEVEAIWHPPRRGLRDRLGVPLEPDDAEEIVICRVWNSAGQSVEFTGFEAELIELAWRRPRE